MSQMDDEGIFTENESIIDKLLDNDNGVTSNNPYGLPVTDLNAKIVQTFPKYQNYPRLNINVKEDKHGKVSYIFQRWNGYKYFIFGKKNYQELVFTDISNCDYEYYEKGIAKLHVSLLDFIKHTTQCHHAVYSTTDEIVVQMFEKFNIDTLPRTIYYIQTMIAAQVSDNARFQKYLATIRYTIDKCIVDTVKCKLLLHLLEVYSSYTFDHENDTNYLLRNPDIPSIHVILDMFTFAPWCYLMLLYKHLNIQAGVLPLAPASNMIENLIKASAASTAL